MQIGIDINEANVDNRVGVNQYAFRLLKAIYLGIAHPVCGNMTFHLFHHSPLRDDFPPESSNWQYHRLEPKKLWTRWRLPLELYLKYRHLDLFWTPSHYSPLFSPVPTIVSIMDLSYLHYSDMFKSKDLYQLKNWTKKSIKQAVHILTISEFTKQEIIKHYQVDPTKITVTHLGVGTFSTTSTLPATSIPEGKYLLYLGTLQPRKNLINLIKAFKIILATRNSQLATLVIAGKKGWLYDEIFSLVKKLKLEKQVIFTGFISEAEKINLIKNAQVLVNPSLYEGFGLPVLESMDLGTPVAVSNCSSHPEIVDQAGVLFDPLQPKLIAQGIIKAIENRQKYSRLGKIQAKQFSWQKCAQKTLKTFYEIQR